MEIDTYQFFQRKNEPNPESPGSPSESHEDLRGDVLEAVEGTVTSLRHTFNDTLFGYQALIGVDCEISDRVSAGIKLRWAKFNKFEGDDQDWDTIRSHESVLAREQSDIDALEAGGVSNRNQVRGTTNDIAFWGAAVSIKYWLN